MRRHTALAVAFLLTAAPAASEVNDLERFKLWNDCRPMDLLVEPLQNDESDINLTKDAIDVAARGRLRAARLYSDDPDKTAEAYLYVMVTVKDSATTVGIAYHKAVQDLATNLSGLLGTWRVISTGPHGQDRTIIVSNVARLTGKFIDEYLRVNEDACK